MFPVFRGERTSLRSGACHFVTTREMHRPRLWSSIQLRDLVPMSNSPDHPELDLRDHIDPSDRPVRRVRALRSHGTALTLVELMSLLPMPRCPPPGEQSALAGWVFPPRRIRRGGRSRKAFVGGSPIEGQDHPTSLEERSPSLLVNVSRPGTMSNSG